MLCARFCVDSPYALSVGGTKNGFQIMDVRQMQSGSGACQSHSPLHEEFTVTNQFYVSLLPSGPTVSPQRFDGACSSTDKHYSQYTYTVIIRDYIYLGNICNYKPQIDA